MSYFCGRSGKLASCSVLALLAAATTLAGADTASAQDNTANQTSAGAEGTAVAPVIVTAERSKAAANAPTKASIEETQPEAIISHKFIEQVTKEDGSWVTTAGIAPSVSGTPSNGGGVGETTKLSMRGFQDGQFNLTYDGIAFGDTNGPTHHEASYWPASTIGAIVIDRGPGAAGDLGPANFGGAIHFFSPELTDSFHASQKLTYGSFDTLAAVTTISGPIGPEGSGAKALINFDERSSAGELSYSSGTSQNQLAKIEIPLAPKWDMTLFSSLNQTHFYQNDGTGSGETWAQVEAYGKNFALNNIPGDEHYYKYNQEYKQTDFEYVDFKGELTPQTTVEDQLYTYFYSNKTKSASSNADLVGSNASSLISGNTILPGESASDLQGYDKLNMYRVNGDILRLSQDLPFGTLKVGGVYEWSMTDRHNILEDITDNWAPDDKFTVAKYPLLPGLTNDKLMENSAWQDYQLFADFYWRPLPGLTITPGFKYVSEHLQVAAADENTAGGSKNQPLYDSATESAPVYFLTGNYKILPYWSVYAQYATSFLYPNISSLYFAGAGAGLQSIQPQQTKTYQTGTVFSRGNFTADADVYRVDATNLLQQCGSGVNTAECDVGTARYTGVEGELAYAFDFGITLFANGSSNVAKQIEGYGQGTGVNNPNAELPNTPRWTEAFGAIYNHGPIQASLTYKQSGAYVGGYVDATGGGTNNGKALNLPGYNSLDASASYDFGRFKIKLQGFNLADNRAITSYTQVTQPNNAVHLYEVTGNNGAADQSYYQFQAGREVDLTLQAKF